MSNTRAERKRRSFRCHDTSTSITVAAGTMPFVPAQCSVPVGVGQVPGLLHAGSELTAKRLSLLVAGKGAARQDDYSSRLEGQKEAVVVFLERAKRAPENEAVTAW